MISLSRLAAQHINYSSLPCCKRRVQKFSDTRQPIENNKGAWGNIAKFLFNDHIEGQISSAQRVSVAYDRFKDPSFQGEVWDNMLSGIVLKDNQEGSFYRTGGIVYYIGDKKDFKNHQNTFRPRGIFPWSGFNFHKDPNIVTATRDPSGIYLCYMGGRIDLKEICSLPSI